MTKKMVLKYKEEIQQDIDGQSLGTAIKVLLELKEKYGDDVRLELDTTYDGSAELWIVESELESDSAYQQRLQSEERQQEIREEFERRVFERLSKKFNNV